MSLDALGAWLIHAYSLSVVPLGLACVLSYALLYQRASVRHHVWAIAVGVTLMAPAASMIAPGIDASLFAGFAPSQISPNEHRSAVATGAPDSEATETVASSYSRPVSTNAVVGILWLAGVLPLLFVRVLRRARVARVLAAAHLLDDSSSVRTHEDVVVPMLAGLRHPAVLLPASATHWPQEEVDAVVIHERAHLMRRDHVAALMIDFATTAYWLNPLVWIAARAIEHEREQACDNEVLHMGVKPSVYAAALLRVADAVSARAKQPTLAMDGGRLDRRIRAVLADSSGCSGGVPLSWTTTVVLTLLCTLAATSVNIVARAPSAQVEEILATVNGETLSNVDLDRRQSAAAHVLEQQTAGNITGVQLPQLLVDAVDEMLVVERGRDLGFKLGDEQFRSVLENIRTQHKLENDEQLHAALAQEHLTEVDLRQQLEREMIVSRMQFTQVFSRVTVTQAEVQQYYETHPGEFSQVPLARIGQEIADRVAATKRKQDWSKYLATLRSKAVVDWKADDLKQAYESGLARQAGGQDK